MESTISLKCLSYVTRDVTDREKGCDLSPHDELVEETAYNGVLSAYYHFRRTVRRGDKILVFLFMRLPLYGNIVEIKIILTDNSL